MRARLWLALAVTLAMTGLAVDRADARPRRTRAWVGFGSTSPLPVILSDSTYYDDLQLAVLPAYSAHMWQEGADAVALTSADTDAQSVGEIDDPSQAAHVVQWLTAARRGVLRTDAGGRSYVECRAASSNDVAQVIRSERAFQFCHSSRDCTIILWAGTIANGTTQTLIDSTNASAAASALGFSVFKNTSNQIVFYNSNGSGGASCNVNSGAATLLAASGIVPIGVRVSGTAVEFNVGAAAEVTATCSAAGTAGTMTYPLTICGSGATTGSTDMNFGGLMVFDRRLTDAEYAAVVADYTGARSARSLVIERPAPYYYNFLSQYYDLRETTAVFSDSGATTAADVLDPIAVVRDPRDLTNVWNRGATSTVAAAPTWRGGFGAHWSGSGSQALVWPQWSMGGGRTVIVRALNEDHTNGSHVLQGSSYVPITGADYASNPGGAAYFTVHPASGAVLGSSLVDERGWNTLEVRRSGATWSGSVDGQNATSASSSAIWAPTNIGRPGSDALTAWRMHGYVQRLARYNAALTDAQLTTIREGWEAETEEWRNEGGVRRTSGGTYMELAVNAGDALDLSAETEGAGYTICSWAYTVGDGVDYEGVAFRLGGGGVGQEQFYLLVDPVVYCAGGANQTWTLGIGQTGHGVFADCSSYDTSGTPQFVCGRYTATLTSSAGAGAIFINGVDRTARYSTGRPIPATPGNEVAPTVPPLTAPLRVANLRNNGDAGMDTLAIFNCPLTDAEILAAYCATQPSPRAAACSGVNANASTAIRSHSCLVDMWRFDDAANLGASETGLHDLGNTTSAEAAPDLP